MFVSTQLELDSIDRQVREVEDAVSRGVVAPAQVSPVLDGLTALAASISGVEAQSRATSLDHIESGQDEAHGLSQHLQVRGGLRTCRTIRAKSRA